MELFDNLALGLATATLENARDLHAAVLLRYGAKSRNREHPSKTSTDDTLP